MYLRRFLPFSVANDCSIGMLTCIMLKEEGKGSFCLGRGRRVLAQGTGSSAVGMLSWAMVMLTITSTARRANSGCCWLIT